MGSEGEGGLTVLHLATGQVQAQGQGRAGGVGSATNCREEAMWEETTETGVELRNLR